MNTAVSVNGILNLGSVLCAAFAFTAANNLKTTLANSCVCAPSQKQNTVDCNMNGVATSGYINSLISLVLAILGLISTLIIFGTSKQKV